MTLYPKLDNDDLPVYSALSRTDSQRPSYSGTDSSTRPTHVAHLRIVQGNPKQNCCCFPIELCGIIVFVLAAAFVIYGFVHEGDLDISWLLHIMSFRRISTTVKVVLLCWESLCVILFLLALLSKNHGFLYPVLLHLGLIISVEFVLGSILLILACVGDLYVLRGGCQEYLVDFFFKVFHATPADRLLNSSALGIIMSVVLLMLSLVHSAFYEVIRRLFAHFKSRNATYRLIGYSSV